MQSLETSVTENEITSKWISGHKDMYDNGKVDALAREREGGSYLHL